MKDTAGNPPEPLGRWTYRFVVVHVVTYIMAGMAFMALQHYATAFASRPAFATFRPLDSPIVRAAPLLQILRGAFLALVLAPVREQIRGPHGWFILFGLLFGLTAIGAVNAHPGSIEGLIYTTVSWREHLIGLPEVFVQTTLFSLWLWRWEQRAARLTPHADIA